MMPRFPQMSAVNSGKTSETCDWSLLLDWVKLRARWLGMLVVCCTAAHAVAHGMHIVHEQTMFNAAASSARDADCI